MQIPTENDLISHPGDDTLRAKYTASERIVRAAAKYYDIPVRLRGYDWQAYLPSGPHEVWQYVGSLRDLAVTLRDLTGDPEGLLPSQVA